MEVSLQGRFYRLLRSRRYHLLHHHSAAGWQKCLYFSARHPQEAHVDTRQRGVDSTRSRMERSVLCANRSLLVVVRVNVSDERMDVAS